MNSLFPFCLANLVQQRNAASHASCRVHNAMVNAVSNGAVKLLDCEKSEHLNVYRRTSRQEHLRRRKKTQAYLNAQKGVGAPPAHDVVSFPTQNDQVLKTTAPGTCSGTPFFGIPYNIDGHCHSMGTQYGGPFYYIATLTSTSITTHSVNITMWYEDQAGASAKVCQGTPSHAPHSQSPFDVPIDECFRVPSGTSELDLDFYYNVSAGTVTEVLWHVTDLKSCAWWESGIPSNTPPAPTPTQSPTQSLLIQNYNSNDCDPTSVTKSGGNAWTRVGIDTCNTMGNGLYFSLGCSGVDVSVKTNCTDATCSECGIVQTLVLGNCNGNKEETRMTGEAKSARVLYLGDAECPSK